MVLTVDYMPQFREAEECGVVGARGYLRYFQDVMTRHTHELHIGNDTLIEETGHAWIISKYRLKALTDIDFNEELRLETWAVKGKSSVKAQRAFRAFRGDELIAIGNSESAVLDVATQRVTRLDEIDFPYDVAEDRDIELPKFERLRFSQDDAGMERVYTFDVRYTHLDNNHHMNNLHFSELVMDAFDSAFHGEWRVSDLQIDYVQQCHEGDEVDVFRCKEDGEGDVWDVVGVLRSSGEVAVRSRLVFERR